MKNEETVITKTIEYQESDYCGYYRLSDMFSTLSSLATKNAMEIGIWKEELAKNYGWVLIKQTVKLTRPISINEQITLATRAGKSSRIQFTRHYDIKDQQLNVIGGVYSIWALIDLQQRCLVRPDKIGANMPEIIEYPHFVEHYQNIDQTIEMTYQKTREVLYSDLDINLHMTNHRYIEWAIDLLDYTILKEYFISEMSMVYKKELAPNAKTRLYYGIKDTLFRVSMVSEDEQTVHFELSGKLTPLIKGK